MHTSLTPPPSAPERRTFRCTFTLPIPLAKAISEVAKGLGISQSALLAQVLDQPMQDLVRLLALAPPSGSPPDAARRWAGSSADLIRQRVQEALRAADVVDPGLPLGDRDR